MILFPELPPKPFKPVLSFFSQAECDAFMAVARIPKSRTPSSLFEGIDVRVSVYVPRGVAILNTPDGFAFFEIPQGFDANGSPA